MDVALSLTDEQTAAMIEGFAARPADVPVMTGMRRAEVAPAGESEATDVERARHQHLHDLVVANPALMAACVERSAARIDELARLIEVRMGVDPAVDPRPHLVASVVLGTRTTPCPPCELPESVLRTVTIPGREIPSVPGSRGVPTADP